MISQCGHKGLRMMKCLEKLKSKQNTANSENYHKILEIVMKYGNAGNAAHYEMLGNSPYNHWGNQ